MQDQLDFLYNEYLTKLFEDPGVIEKITNYEISSPIFLDVNTPKANYIDSEYRVAFVGKETNYWFNNIERTEFDLNTISIDKKDKYIYALKQIYLRGNLGEKYRTPIFTFFDVLKNKLEEKVKLGMINTNLIRHDYFGKGGLPDELICKVAFENNFIFRKEIEILNPNAMVFVTGPNYDVHIKKTYKDVTFEKYKNYSIREVAVLENIPNIEKVIRIYHPDAHWRKGADYRHDRVNDIFDYFFS